MKAIVLTSTFRRHMFVANTVAAGCEVVGVWQEEKTFRPERYAQDADDERVIQEHFAARDASEAAYFQADDEIRLDRGAECRTGSAGVCNGPAEVARMVAARPDVVLVFGTGILREPLLSAFDGRIITSLWASPYYRGAGTNFWPLVNREPEYVGETIHYITTRASTGSYPRARATCPRTGRCPMTLATRRFVRASHALLRAAEAHVAAPRTPFRSGAAAGCTSERTSVPMRFARFTGISIRL